VTVLAILHLVAGTIDLIGVVCGGLSQAMGGAGMFAQSPGPGGGPNPAAAVQNAMAAIPGYQAFTYGNLAVTSVLGVLLLAAGVGLLGMNPWARALSLVYAVLAILVRIGEFLYTVLVVVPGMDAFMQQQMAVMAPPGGGPPSPQAQAAAASFMRATMMFGAIFGLLFIAYPITVLIILNLRSVKAAFRGEEAVGLPADLEDEGWGAIRRPGLTTDVTTEPDPDRDRFQPPDA
jgi:hypothetical protein